MFGFINRKKRERLANEWVEKIVDKCEDDIKVSIHAGYFYCDANIEQELLISISDKLRAHNIKIWYGLATSSEVVSINNAPCIYWEYDNRDSSNNGLSYIWRYDNYVSHNWGKIELMKSF